MQLRSRFSTVLAAMLLIAAAGAAMAQQSMWSWQYAGPAAGDNSAVKIKSSPDGTVVVAGLTTGDDNTADVLVAKLASVTGETLWVRTWRSDVDMTDLVRELAVDDSGSIFVVGNTFPWMLNNRVDWVTLKYAPDGTLEWSAIYNNGAFDLALGALPDGKGGVLVTGTSQTDIARPSSGDITTIHYGATGDTLWTARYNGPGDRDDYAWALASAPDGSAFYVQGHVYVDAVSTWDWVTIKYDTLGDTVWSRTYSGSANNPAYPDFSFGIATDGAGNVYATGLTGELATSYDATTIKYAPDGTRLWVNALDNGRGTDDFGYRISLAAGGAYIGGTSYKDPWSDAVGLMATRIDATTGLTDWSWFFGPRYPDGDGDTLGDMVVDAGGNVYLTGTADNYNGDNVWETFKLDPRGQVIWTTPDSVLDEYHSVWGICLDAGGDVYAAGNADSTYFRVVKYTEPDAGVMRVVLAADSFRIGATIQPKAWVRSYSALTQHGIDVRLDVPGYWSREQAVDSILPHDSLLVTFSSKTFEPTDAGTHDVVCYTMLSGDADRANDTAYSRLTVVPGWQRLANVPDGPHSKQVKDGAALTIQGDSLVYAFKGNNTLEFYKYNIGRDSWAVAETIPYQGRTTRKRVKAGSGLAADTGRSIYALKGNNSLDFWRYTVGGDSWRQLDDVPIGTLNKRVKAGSDMVYVPWKHAIYATKGASTFEFYYFDIARDTWLPRASVIPGVSGNKVKDGSRLAYDGDSAIYLIKGGKLEFYRYSIAKDSWKQMPDIGYSANDVKRRKFKKGSGLVFDPVNRRLLAMKGGKGTEFWQFPIALNTWLELPATDMYPVPPGSKPPYAGTAMAASKGKVYSTKGNRTFEFWRYNADLPFNPAPAAPGPQTAGTTALGRFRLDAAPNPFGSRTMLSWTLSQPGHVRLALYDVTGRSVRTLVDEWQTAGSHSVSLQSDGLSVGVYLASLVVRNEVISQQTTRKLTLTR